MVRTATAEDMASTWTEVSCTHCSGYGLRSHYTMSGDDFLGAIECDVCDGTGAVWLSPSKTRIAKWPGGPFVGRK